MIIIRIYTRIATQARAMQWLASLSREGWQERLDAAAKVFGGDEAPVSKNVRSGSPRAKSAKASKKVLHEVA